MESITHPLVTIRPELLSLSEVQATSLFPYFALLLGVVFLIVACSFKRLQSKWIFFIVASLASLAGIAYSLTLWDGPALSLFNGMMIADNFSHFFNLIFLGSAFFTLCTSFKYLDKEILQFGEYYLLILFSALGMMLMASGSDLIVIFIALEIMSLSIYTLVGFRRADRRSNEAAMKYFILGSVASAVLLYGTALLYGATQSTHIQEIFKYSQQAAHAQTTPPIFALGVLLVIIGFLFKVASVPFHMWMPDVYEGAPAPVTGFMTTGLKAAAFAAFLRVFISTGYGKGLAVDLQRELHHIIWISALLTMVLGNLVALTQTNLKRMLAYSSIAHTGYLLVGLLAGSASDQGYTAMGIYLVSYSIMNLGAFAVLTILAAKGDVGINLHDFSGLSGRRPWLAFAMAIFLFSMAGIPPTAGFAGKYLLFYSAVQAGEIWLVVLAVLCSAVSAYFYLRVIVYMYMREPVDGNAPEGRIPGWAALTVVTMVFLTLQIGIIPAKMVAAAKKAVTSL